MEKLEVGALENATITAEREVSVYETRYSFLIKPNSFFHKL